MVAVRVEGLTKTYDGRPVLDRVDLGVAAGSVHGLLGPNGAGKTTLLRVLVGLVAADSGTVRLLGRPAVGPGLPLDLDGVGGFLATPAFYPYLTARQNLRVLARLDGSGAGRVDDALERVGLAERAGQRVAVLSSGLRQRLALAAALLRAPRLLVLDEPGNSLDPAGLAMLHQLVRDLREQGTAVLLCSHDLGEVEQLCDTVTALDRGRVVLDSDVASLRVAAGHGNRLVRTSDDALAATVPVAGDEVRATPDGLELAGSEADVDAWVLALATRGVAVRAMSVRSASLTDLFLRVTGA